MAPQKSLSIFDFTAFKRAGKLAIAANLADLADVAAARGNLGLGSMATQAANNVAITSGSVDGVTLDGGTF